MNSLVSTFIKLLRLRAGPQDLPVSWILTTTVIAIYLFEGMYTVRQLGDEDAAIKSLSISVLQFSAVAVMLYVRKYPERLAQTLSALAGTGVILGFFAFLFVTQADPGQNQPMLALAWFGIFIWSLAVDAHIYRNALSISMHQGVLVAVMLLAASYLLIEAMF